MDLTFGPESIGYNDEFEFQEDLLRDPPEEFIAWLKREQLSEEIWKLLGITQKHEEVAHLN